VARRRNGRRSQRRLGRQYPSSARRVRFALAPAPGHWQILVSRLAAAMLLVLAGWVIYAVFNSPNFYVYDIQVRGNAAVTSEEVYTTSDLEGLSVFWVDPAAVARRVETLPNVRSAHVKIRLPARVIVTVEERAPVILWQTGDVSWWVDAEGVIFPPRADPSDTLTIIDTDAQPVSPGEALDPSIIETAQSLRRLLPELPVMHYSRATGVSFTTGEGWPVYLGDGRDMDEKLTILVNLRKDLLARGVTPEFIDVRFIERPFYK
jgi:cell division septal protein FtsQ